MGPVRSPASLQEEEEEGRESLETRGGEPGNAGTAAALRGQNVVSPAPSAGRTWPGCRLAAPRAAPAVREGTERWRTPCQEWVLRAPRTPSRLPRRIYEAPGGQLFIKAGLGCGLLSLPSGSGMSLPQCAEWRCWLCHGCSVLVPGVALRCKVTYSPSSLIAAVVAQAFALGGP